MHLLLTLLMLLQDLTVHRGCPITMVTIEALGLSWAGLSDGGGRRQSRPLLVCSDTVLCMLQPCNHHVHSELQASFGARLCIASLSLGHQAVIHQTC